jgi:hypothetical protein
MRRIFKILVFALIVYISYSAYQSSLVNGKSFWFNLGKQSKEVVADGKEKTVAVVKDVSSGLKSTE